MYFSYVVPYAHLQLVPGEEPDQMNQTMELIEEGSGAESQDNDDALHVDLAEPGNFLNDQNDMEGVTEPDQILENTTMIDTKEDNITKIMNMYKYNKIRQIHMIEELPNDSDNNLTKIGLHIAKKQDVVIGQDFITLNIFNPLKKYLDAVDMLQKVSNKTMEKVLDFAKIHMNNMSNTAFNGKPEIKQIQLCQKVVIKIDQIPEENIEGMTDICTKVSTNRFVKKVISTGTNLHIHVLDLCRDATKRINNLLNVYTTPKSRQKRGILDPIGTMEKQLFGVAIMDDIYPIHDSITALEEAGTKILFTLNSSVIALNTQFNHLQNLNHVVLQLQEIMLNITYAISEELNQELTLGTILSNVIQLTSINSVFGQVTSTLHNINNKVNEVARNLQNAVEGHFSPSTICPTALLLTLSEYREKNFVDEEQYLWPLQKLGDTYSIYKNVQVSYSREAAIENVPMISVRIPIVTKYSVFKHFEILSLPTQMTRGGVSSRIKINQGSMKINVLQKNGKIYKIQNNQIKESIESQFSILNNRILEPIIGKEKDCINSVLHNNSIQILKTCEIKSNTRQITIHKIREGKFIYNIEKRVNATIQCPNSKILGPFLEQNITLQNYGILKVSPECNLFLNEKSFFGKPKQWAKLQIVKNISIRTINTTGEYIPYLWEIILDKISNITLERLNQTYTNLMRLNNSDLKTKYEDTERILVKLKHHIATTKLAQDRANILIRIMNDPRKLSLITLVIIIIIILSISICLIIYVENKIKRKQYKPIEISWVEDMNQSLIPKNKYKTVEKIQAEPVSNQKDILLQNMMERADT